MNANELMFMVLLLWIFWFFCGGAWALIRLAIGCFGFKDGENKWSGFASLFWWFLVNTALTIWYYIEYGGTM